MQKRIDSFIEANTNTFAGFILSALMLYLILPWFFPEVERDLIKSGAMTLIFTALSIARNYFVRRFFNWKQAHEIADPLPPNVDLAGNNLDSDMQPDLPYYRKSGDK